LADVRHPGKLLQEIVSTVPASTLTHGTAQRLHSFAQPPGLLVELPISLVEFAGVLPLLVDLPGLLVDLPGLLLDLLLDLLGLLLDLPIPRVQFTGQLLDLLGQFVGHGQQLSLVPVAQPIQNTDCRSSSSIAHRPAKSPASWFALDAWS
jgi:hypothetical protein